MKNKGAYQHIKKGFLIMQPIKFLITTFFQFNSTEVICFILIFSSIIGCGLTQVQYAFNNITSKSRLAVKFFAKVIRYVKQFLAAL